MPDEPAEELTVPTADEPDESEPAWEELSPLSGSETLTDEATALPEDPDGLRLPDAAISLPAQPQNSEVKQVTADTAKQKIA